MNRSKQLQVTTGSRLHFGLFSVGRVDDQPQFGGCGMMVKHPQNQITLQAGCTKPNQEPTLGIEKWIGNVKKAHGDLSEKLSALPSIQINRSAARHSGFGSGTQLALATGLALSTWYKLAICDVDQLSTIMERGLRSAIGAHGFFRGGFLVDRGKRNDGELASLDLNLSFPETWPVLILNLKSAHGIHGEAELAAFRKLPTSTRAHRDRMIDMVKKQIAPSVDAASYDDFGEALFEYGRSSGSAYASIQGGDFHSPAVEQLVYRVRDFGVPAVGQSSWGPCVFAVTRNDNVANSLTQFLGELYGDSLEICKTSALNKGAEIKWQDLE
ncbi:hypothetical protein OAG68_00860 [bacterium]|nr:hypothetical protein [bacterium]